MVFIFLGAIKAAKTAKLEYEKDKKRTAMIVPVEGSLDMMADRGEASSSSSAAAEAGGGGGADTWWGTARPKAGATATTQPADDKLAKNHSALGCWSREQQPRSQQDADNVYASTSTASAPVRPASQSSGSEMGSQVLALPAPAPPPARDPVPTPATAPRAEPRHETPLQQKREQRTRKPRLPAPADGSFEAALRGAGPRAASSAAGAAPTPRSPRRVDAHDAAGAAAAIAPSGEKLGAKADAEKPADDGSFAAAMRAPTRKPSRARQPEQPRPAAEAAPASDGSYASAMPATPVRKPSRVRPAGQPPIPVLAKANSAETDGSFAAAMQKESCRGSHRRETDAGSALMEKHTSALAYPAGSKAKARPPARGAQTRTAEPGAAAAVNSATGDLQSSLRKEGSMKRRVSRR